MATVGRAAWKGLLKLSLVTAPVRLAPATAASQRIHLHELNKSTGNRVHIRLVDAETEDEVPRENLVKGYEYAKGQYIALTQAEIDTIRIESTHTITIDRFVDASAVDEIYLDAPYYIIPDGKAADEPYAAIREAMNQSNKAAIGRVTLSSREHPVLIKPCGKGMTLTTLRPEREVRHADDYFGNIPKVKLTPDLIDMAKALVKSREGAFEPKHFVDEYQEALRTLVEAKAKGKIPKALSAAPRSANVISLMDALKRSLESKQRGDAKSPKPRTHPEPAISGKSKKAAPKKKVAASRNRRS